MIILDSSFLISFENELDINHQKALKLMEKISNNTFGQAVITDYIFGEIVTITSIKSKNHTKALFLGDKLIESMQIFSTTKEVFNLAWDIFKKQSNTQLSFTDCSILSLMRNEEVSNIATFDKDFEKIEGISVIK